MFIPTHLLNLNLPMLKVLNNSKLCISQAIYQEMVEDEVKVPVGQKAKSHSLVVKVIYKHSLNRNSSDTLTVNFETNKN
jgi:hypothetical protein